MIYVMSDLHGRYDLYEKMLDKLRLDETDTLYILGDFLDRGPDGFKIIFDIEKHHNIIPLIGNHDYTASIILSRLADGIPAEQYVKMKELIEAWLTDGGKESYDEFRALSKEKRQHALELIAGFRRYATVSVGDKDFVLVHGGLGGYEEGKSLSEYTVEQLAFTRADYSKPPFSEENKYLVTGHTPTIAIEGGERGRILKQNRHVAIDCGAVFDFGLGCICLDNMKEFYVK